MSLLPWTTCGAWCGSLPAAKDSQPIRLVSAVNAPTRVWSGREQELEEKRTLMIRFQPF